MAVNFVRGSSQYILFAQNAVWDGADAGQVDREHVWSVWLRPDAVNVDQYIYSLTASAVQYHCRIMANGAVQHMMYDTGTAKFLFHLSAAATAQAGEWQHLLYWYDGSETAAGLKCYFNGTSIATSTLQAGYTGMRSDLDDAFWIGGRSGDANYYDGQMEDFRMWSGTNLTNEQIQALVAGHRGPIGGETCWVDLSLARGAYAGACAQGTNLFPDLTGNGHDGDPYNNPTLVPSTCPRMGVAI